MQVSRVQGVVTYGKNTGVSGRALGTALEGRRGLVNWTGAPLREALNERVTTDKLDQLELLKLGDVPIPEFSTSRVQDWAGRTRFHTKGRDFQPRARRGRVGTTPDFWVKMYPSKAEWRMHVCRIPGKPQSRPDSYEVFRTGQKVRGETDARGVEWEGFPIRSRDFGWALKYWRTGTRPNCLAKFVTAAKWAVSCLHWDFGAVDLLQLENGSPMVLEVNSCPSLRDDNTLRAYAERLGALLEE